MGILGKTGPLIVRTTDSATRSRISRFDNDVNNLIEGRISSARYNAAWQGRQIAGVKVPSAGQVKAMWQADPSSVKIPQISPGTGEAAAA
jgi:hypothetical protein